MKRALPSASGADLVRDCQDSVRTETLERRFQHVGSLAFGHLREAEARHDSIESSLGQAVDLGREQSGCQELEGMLGVFVPQVADPDRAVAGRPAEGLSPDRRGPGRRHDGR